MLEAIIEEIKDARGMILDYMQDEDGPDGFAGMEFVNECMNTLDHLEAGILHLTHARELQV